MQVLNENIQKKQFYTVYLLFGNEPFLRNSYKKQLKQAMIGDDEMNYSHFEGKDTELSKIKDLSDTLPFFADRRVIIIEESGLFKGSCDGWTEYISQIPETTTIVFVESEVDKRNRLYKKVKDVGYAAELGKQSEAQLKRWVMAMLHREQRKITADALDLFLYKVGDDMENIKMELEKVISYSEGEEGITSKIVEDICVERTTNRIFEMIEAVSAGNEKKALNLYYDLLSLKEPSMRILFLIARQFNQLMVVKNLMSVGESKDSIGNILKIKSFIAGKLMTQARVFSKEQLREYVTLCVESEEAIKTGGLAEKVAVEMVIVKIARRKEIEQKK